MDNILEIYSIFKQIQIPRNIKNYVINEIRRCKMETVISDS